MKDILIIGGGLAGLTAAIRLARDGFSVGLIERKYYPFHRVCGEYISQEVVPYLKSLDIYPDHLPLPQLDRFQLSAISGRQVEIPLPLGGFGISRYFFDDFLFQKAQAAGVQFYLGQAVESITFQDQLHTIQLSGGETLSSRLVLGAFGKRSNLDRQMNRSFMQARSPYIGVKYHIRYPFPDSVIALHNFPGGYCGISQVEKGVVNLCYLGSQSDLRKYKDIGEMEKATVHQNPHLRKIFNQAEFIFDKPLVINEISFAPKKPVENNMLMIGDSAGLITPLCGNGMALAIHSAKLACDLIVKHFDHTHDFNFSLTSDYTRTWENHFRMRLRVGRSVQKLFGNGTGSGFAVQLARTFPSVAAQLIKQTHGKAF